MNEDEKKDNGEEGEESFADLLAQSFVDAGRLEPGQKVEATVLKIGGDWVFVDVGQKGEGVLDRKELLDADGQLTVAEGDRLPVYFLSSRGGEMRFTVRLGGDAGSGQLEEAWRGGIPVDGLVEKEVKGGFEVKVAGRRAFCPFSQIVLRGGSPEEFVGRHLSFRIARYDEGGRNIVLSRRALLEEERARQKEALKGSLREGEIVHGTVTRVQDFGAFVDIGGVEGLLPVSEVGWGRVEEIRDHLREGQEVAVVVKAIDWERERFTFSLRETLADPWLEAARNFPEGSCHRGRVSRLAPFGAFVTLADGVDGLLHISRLGAGRRLSHPREAVKEGEELEVKVEQVDRESRRISLSLAEVSRAQEEEAQTLEAFRRQAESAPAGMGTLGDLLKAKLERKGKQR